MKRIITAVCLVIFVFALCFCSEALSYEDHTGQYIGEGEYEEYVRETDLPIDFVRAEQVSVLGDFYQLKIYYPEIHEDNYGDYYHNQLMYEYFFFYNDDYRYQCKLVVFHHRDLLTDLAHKTIIHDIPQNVPNVRNLGLEDTIYEKHGLKYVYDNDGILQYMT